MPTLNRDILEDILVQSIKYNAFHPLIMFMTTSKEHFNVALNHFFRARSITINEINFEVMVPYRDGLFVTHKMSYYFTMLKPILKAIGPCFTELNVCEYPEGASKRRILMELIKKSPMNIVLYEKLPSHFEKVLRKRRRPKTLVLYYPTTDAFM